MRSQNILLVPIRVLFRVYPRLYPESILHIPRWMIFGNIERIKIIIFALYFRSVRDLKSDLAENPYDVIDRLRQRMEVALICCFCFAVFIHNAISRIIL